MEVLELIRDDKFRRLLFMKPQALQRAFLSNVVNCSNITELFIAFKDNEEHSEFCGFPFQRASSLKYAIISWKLYFPRLIF